MFSPDGKRLLLSVGSGSNVALDMFPEPLIKGGRQAWIKSKPLGATWDTEERRADVLSYDPDGKDEKIWILDRRSLEILTSFGDGGRQPGQFFAVHSIAVDSKGNIFTTETYEGRRLQKFVYKGLAPVTKMDQGTVWPK